MNSIRFQPVRVSIGDSVLVLTSGDQTAHVWKVNSSQLSERDSEDEKISQLPDGDHPSSLQHSSSAKNTTKMLANYPLMVFRSHSSVVSCAEWIGNGDQVITASWDRCAMVFDVETGGELAIVITLN